MFSFSSNEFGITNVDRVIGNAVFDIIKSGAGDHISQKMLIEHLTRRYIYIYENSSSVEETLVYESALKLLMNSPE